MQFVLLMAFICILLDKFKVVATKSESQNKKMFVYLVKKKASLFDVAYSYY